MRALCAARVSLVSLGMALLSISSLSAPSLVRWSTVTLVIFVLARVTCTCMGPYWVFATVPVTVRADARLLALVLLAGALAFLLAAGLAEPDPVPPAIGCAVAVDADGVLVAGSAAASECVLNDSSAASPAAVPPRVSRARR